MQPCDTQLHSAHSHRRFAPPPCQHMLRGVDGARAMRWTPGVLYVLIQPLGVSCRRRCRLVRDLTESDGVPGAAALVRGVRYTQALRTGCTYPGAECSSESLDPQCASEAADCVEQRCAASASSAGIDVRFNSRTYLLANSGAHLECARRRRSFGDGHNYTCVDYDAGAYHLAGQTLSFSVDVSGSGCGCNIAIYMTSMPQNADATVGRGPDALSTLGHAPATLGHL